MLTDDDKTMRRFCTSKHIGFESLYLKNAFCLNDLPLSMAKAIE